MLDEKLEYLEYTKPLKKNATPRLHPEIFAMKSFAKKTQWNVLLGLPRCLTIIARHYLFDENDYTNANPSEQQEIIAHVTDALKAWCGFSDEDSSCDEFPFKGWLEKYYHSHIEPLGKGVPTWEDVKAKKKRAFTSRIFPKMPSETKNDIHVTNYERIIARAIHEGPLCTYYLACKKEYASVLQYNDKLINQNTIMHTRYRDFVLRCISLYLLEKRRAPDNDFVSFNLMDLSHWRQRPPHSKTLAKTLEPFSYVAQGKKTALFSTLLISGNSTKLSISKEYLNAFDFKIIKKEELKNLPSGYIYFTDKGSGVDLCEKKQQ